MALLEKDRARAAMEAACRCTANILGFRPPGIPHTVTVMVIALIFHTKYPYGMGDALNFFFTASPPQ